MNSNDSDNSEEDSKNIDNVDDKLFNDELSVISIINMIKKVEIEELNKLSKLKIVNKNINNIIITKLKKDIENNNNNSESENLTEDEIINLLNKKNFKPKKRKHDYDSSIENSPKPKNNQNVIYPKKKKGWFK